MKTTFTNEQTKVVIAFGLVGLNVWAGHVMPPNSIFLSPVVAGIGAALICTGYRKPVFASALCLLLLLVQDIGVRLFAGGNNDQEGLGWVSLFFLLSAISTFVVLLATIINGKHKKMDKAIAILLLPLSVAVYLCSGISTAIYYS